MLDFKKNTMEEVLKKLEEQERKIEAIYVSVEKTRKYILISLIVSLIFFVLPLMAAVIMVPIIFNLFSSIYSGI